MALVIPRTWTHGQIRASWFHIEEVDAQALAYPSQRPSRMSIKSIHLRGVNCSPLQEYVNVVCLCHAIERSLKFKGAPSCHVVFSPDNSSFCISQIR